MIKNLAFVLDKAREEKKCVPAINVYNLETIQAVLDAAFSVQSPIIISFGEGYLHHVPLEFISSTVCLLDKSDLPVVLHLDHAKSLKTIRKALDSGFTSVMYDGSHLPLEENIYNTRKTVEMASACQASVEGELGYLNPEDGSDTAIYTDRYTSVRDADKYVKSTGVDALAVAVGNAHGVYADEPKLEFERIAAIANTVDVPLVLHGSSGIPEDNLKKAISLGVAKINVNTEVSLAGTAAVQSLLGETGHIRFERLMGGARSEMSKVIKSFINIAYLS